MWSSIRKTLPYASVLWVAAYAVPLAVARPRSSNGPPKPKLRKCASHQQP